jgi:hypothetical protein
MTAVSNAAQPEANLAQPSAQLPCATGPPRSCGPPMPTPNATKPDPPLKGSVLNVTQPKCAPIAPPPLKGPPPNASKCAPVVPPGTSSKAAAPELPVPPTLMPTRFTPPAGRGLHMTLPQWVTAPAARNPGIPVQVPVMIPPPLPVQVPVMVPVQVPVMIPPVPVQFTVFAPKKIHGANAVPLPPDAKTTWQEWAAFAASHPTLQVGVPQQAIPTPLPTLAVVLVSKPSGQGQPCAPPADWEDVPEYDGTGIDKCQGQPCPPAKGPTAKQRLQRWASTARPPRPPPKGPTAKQRWVRAQEELQVMQPPEPEDSSDAVDRTRKRPRNSSQSSSSSVMASNVAHVDVDSFIRFARLLDEFSAEYHPARSVPQG